MSIVYLSGDEQNDISREYGLYMKAGGRASSAGTSA